MKESVNWFSLPINLLVPCMCVFTSIHREGFICLEQLDCQGIDQWCCVEDVGFPSLHPGSIHLYFEMQNLTFQLVTLSCSYTRSGHSNDLTSIRLAFRTQGLHSPLTGVAFGTHFIVSRSAFVSALTRGFAIYLGKVKVTTKFSIESNPPSAKYLAKSMFINLCIWKCHISRPKTKTAAGSYWRENEIILGSPRKDDISWYRI